MNDVTHLLPAEYDIHPTQRISLLLFFLSVCLDIFSPLYIIMLVYQMHYVIYGSMNMHKFSLPIIINSMYFYDSWCF